MSIPLYTTFSEQEIVPISYHYSRR